MVAKYTVSPENKLSIYKIYNLIHNTIFTVYVSKLIIKVLYVLGTGYLEIQLTRQP